MMLSAGFHEDVASHGRWVKNRHDFTLKGGHRTAAVKTSVHLVGHSLFGVDGGLDDVEEGSNAAVHFSQHAVSVLHVNVGKDAVVLLEVARVNPFRTGVDTGRVHFRAGSDDQHWDDVNEGAPHVDAALWA